MKSEPAESKSSERSPNVIPETNDTVVNTIKVENVDISDYEEDEKNSDIADSDSAQPYHIENSLSRTTLLSTATGSISLNASTSEADNKYCHICDIKFKYMSSYIAHKKSYCRNIPSELDMGSVTASPASSVIATTRSSPNQTSVVT